MRLYSTIALAILLTFSSIVTAQVVLQWTFTGTHRGPLADIPATGKQVSVPRGIAIFRIEGGKMTQGQFAWDKYALLQQLGVLR